jgi:Tfp pilus assembly protein PilF
MPIRKLVLLILLVTFSLACRSRLPEKSSNDFGAAVKSFYVGLAAMEVADDQRAKTELTNTVKLAANEPAAWANLGILQMRQKDFDASATSLEKARNLAPDNGQIQRNIYVLEAQRGNFDIAVNSLKKAIELDPNDLKAQFALAREYERQNNDADAFASYSQVAATKPGNLSVQLEIARLLAKQGDAEKLKTIFALIAPKAVAWEPEIQKQFQTLQASANGGNVREVSQNIAFFRNVLLRLPEFRAQIAEVRFDETFVGEPFSKPMELPVPDFSPAPPDEDLSFKAEPVANEKARWCKAIYLDGDTAPVVAWANDKEIHIGEKTLPVGASNDLQTIDIDYNYKNDFVAVGDKGLRFFDDNFQEITAKIKLPTAILSRKYLKTYSFDVEADGDLDLVLAAATGPPVVLQNNSDGTFQQIKLFTEIDQLRDFATADIDEDGDTDAATVDANGKLRVYSNERGGQFSLRTTPITQDDSIGFTDSNGSTRLFTQKVPVSESVSAVSFADSNGDGKLDILVLQRNGGLLRTSDKGNGKDWTETVVIASGMIIDKPIHPLGNSQKPIAEASMYFPFVIEDFDNNGSVDIASGNDIWLNGKSGFSFARNKGFDGKISSAADLNGDGRLDLVGLDADGKPAKFINSGAKNYGWQVIRPRSARAEGDQRVNSFGIGGEIEIRSGLLPQKRVITSPQVHFGLGEQTSVDVMRVVWNNGYVQADFDLKPNQTVLAEQRLKGSCPHLFTWDGSKFRMVKDAPPWSPALGLKINAQDTYGILATEEWFKIPGEMLVPKDGSYELRITGEYWEAYYIDNYSLLAVDHPAGTEVFTDERFAIPLPPLKVFTTEPTRPFLDAKNDKSEDVSGIVSMIDEKYLDGFKLGSFQGVAEDHFVELEVPDDAPRDKKLWLVADGWVHPTDASINVELGQSSKPKPKSLSLEVPDENGNWKTLKENLGFPAGKMKTVLIELPIGARRFRLRTNMEIFWDKLAWAADIGEAQNKETRLNLSAAEVRRRGFSVMDKRDASSPEIPDYARILTTTQRWRDLEGYYTRYGDVLDLLTNVDDRYIITGAGDEIVLRFPALPEVQKGWKRDFVIIGNGWIKDGDLNSVFSKTVLPLPTHATNDYSRPPGRLEDDPVYKQHPADWLNFHTRYVAPDQFRNALRIK